MGLLDKIKNTFFEEEYFEVEEKPKKEKKVIEKKKEIVKEEKPEIKETIKEEVKEIKESVKEEKEEIVKEEKVEKKNGFSLFDDDDFLDFEEEVKPVPKKVEHKKVEPVINKTKVYVTEEVKKGPYGGAEILSSVDSNPNTYSTLKQKGFTPTPIISPIYGVLDKNYTKEQLDNKEVKKASSYVSRKNVDLDSIRNKAFGSFEDEFKLNDPNDEIDLVIEETVITDFDDIKEDNNEILEEEVNVIDEDNLLYDMTEDDKTPVVESVTLQDAEEYFNDLGLEYNVDYKDSKLENITGRRANKHNPDLSIDDDEIDVNLEEIDNFDDKEEDLDLNKLEDNLFDLIDSMYEEEE